MTNIDPLVRALSLRQFSLLLASFKEVKKLFAFCEMSQWLIQSLHLNDTGKYK